MTYLASLSPVICCSRSACIRVRKASSAKTANVNSRNGILPTGVLTAPGSIVVQTSTASAIYATKASIRRRVSGLPASVSNQNNWCTGEDSNLRSSKERQIYSLLPLTTRPPVQRKTGADDQD